MYYVIIGYLLVTSLVSPIRGEMLDSEPIQPADWKLCGQELMRKAGRAELIPQLDMYWRESVRKDSEFMRYLMAIIYVESRFQASAVSEMEARGLMQMTQIAVTQAEQDCKLRKVLDMQHLHDRTTNIKYGTCYLSELVEEMEGDWVRALIIYNGGYLSLQKYDKGGNINQETSNYVLQVQRILGTTKECSK